MASLYSVYIKEFDRKSSCQIWFCVAESFLITHLDPPESWKVGGDISYTSSDNCHVIEKLFSPPAPFKAQVFSSSVQSLEQHEFYSYKSDGCSSF